jgi:hypothetical protein
MVGVALLHRPVMAVGSDGLESQLPGSEQRHGILEDGNDPMRTMPAKNSNAHNQDKDKNGQGTFSGDEMIGS